MKNSTLKMMSVPTLALLAVVGCSKDNRSDDDIVVAEPVVQQLDAVCEDPALKMRLDVAIKDAILTASMNRMAGLDPEQALSIQNAFGQQLNNVRIDTQNSTNFADSCMVDVLITPNPEDMVAAEFAFARAGATLLQRASQDQVELTNGTIIAKQVTYQMVNGDIVMYASDHNAIRLAADILLASADTLPEAPSTTGATRPQVIERQVEMPAEALGTEPAVSGRTPAVTTRVERQTTTRTQASPSTEQSQAASTPERQTVRDVAQNTTAEPARSTNTQSRTAPTAHPAPSRAQSTVAEFENGADAAVDASDGTLNDNTITIIESNETY